ncbi:MAG: hypothetical protein Q4B54_12940, partial [Coriobacteriales bacterium]|nr:hypothetical protein [Coriobacteriales bacterium]
VASSVVCNNIEGQRIVLSIEAGTYLDITHLDSDIVMPVLGREHKRYRTVRTIEQPMQARENLTYINHIWHTRVYENRDDAQMVDVLLDLEDEGGEVRRRYVTLPAADVRPDKKNPKVRYAIVRTREVMLHWYDRKEQKTRYERIETGRLSEQTERGYRSYRASRSS